MSLQAVTTVGAVAGVQGFVSGAFDPLVDQLNKVLPPVNGPVLPAAALGLLVGVPQGASFVLGARHHPAGPAAGVASGSALVVWVVAQQPLIGWTSPIQWMFAAVGLAEIAASIAWLIATPSDRS